MAIPAVREIVSGADRDLPIFEIATQTEKIDRTLFQERIIAKLSSFFGILALILACIGVYGLLAYEVSRRTREIGIRMALGASRGTVMRFVLFDGLRVALAGSVIGCGVALAITRYLKSFLFGIKAADPTTFLGAVGILLVIVLAACYLPARRAVRVDPLVALRYE
jgi:ABC-type antimicrobial peptide transport system permease subunit